MTGDDGRSRDGFWDAAYRRGDHLEHWEPEHPPAELAAALATGLVRPGQRALDIGCGAGCEALFLASQGVAVIGVDASAAALEIAARRSAEAGLEVEWRRGDATDLPVASGSIDLAVDRGCFHVISELRRPGYAAEVHRVLRPGGSLLLRGAGHDDDEAGLIGVDEGTVRACFGELGMLCGPLVPLTLTAPSGDLAGRLVVISRPTGGAGVG